MERGFVRKSGAGDAWVGVFHRILSVNQNAAAPPAPPLCCSRVVIALYSFSGITSTFNPSMKGNESLKMKLSTSGKSRKKWLVNSLNQGYNK
jgi:hypothetical protein